MGKELLNRLTDSNKYNVAELAVYCEDGDPRITTFPWKVYPNMPSRFDENAKREYQRQDRLTNVFGEFRFEQVCLDFKPDYVLDMRDPWMFAHQIHSPFRRMYNHIIMPTVDAEPQDPNWLSDYCSADAVMTYTKWAEEVLNREAGKNVNLRGVCTPCANYDTFYPMDRKNCRAQFNIPQDAVIIGFVFRNQIRKASPEMFQAFANLLKTSPDYLKNNLYLYCHTTWPDIGYYITKMLRELGISNRVLFTYMCRNCKVIASSQFREVNTWCPNCKQDKFALPTADEGIPEQVLAKIYNCMDLYVQCAYLEGLGIPPMEAAACGIPIAVVNYSGMADYVTYLDAIAIDYVGFHKEAATSRNWAIPSVKDLTAKMAEFLNLPSTIRGTSGFALSQKVRELYDWDRFAIKWMEIIDELPVKHGGNAWSLPPNIVRPQATSLHEVPQNLQKRDFVRWCIANVAGEPSLLDSYVEHKMTRNLQYEKYIENIGGIQTSELSALGSQNKFYPYTHQNALNDCLQIAEKRNKWEYLRANQSR